MIDVQEQNDCSDSTPNQKYGILELSWLFLQVAWTPPNTILFVGVCQLTKEEVSPESWDKVLFRYPQPQTSLSSRYFLGAIFNFTSGSFPILSRDPSFQKTTKSPRDTAGFGKERRLKRMGHQPLEYPPPFFGWWWFEGPGRYAESISRAGSSFACSLLQWGRQMLRPMRPRGAKRTRRGRSVEKS